MRRWAAPAAFLLAVTIAVLLVRAGLEGSVTGSVRNSPPPPPGPPGTSASIKPPPAPKRPLRHYVIRSGDTFGGIALAEHTSVEKLRALNPGVDPTALHVGQRIRVP